ncbi:MAG: lysophospholipid acyltransferase family protein [Bacillota bacterium]
MPGLFYNSARRAVRLYAKSIMRLEVEGLENVPTEGPLVIMSNHISFQDPPLIGAFLPRPIHFMAKAELFQNKFLAYFLKKLEAFPIRRGTGDSRAFRQAIKVLKKDKVLGIFPEGTRYPEGSPGQPHSGSVMIAIMAKAPILPVGIKNIKRKGRPKLIFGEPFALEEYYGKKLSKKEREKAAQAVMSQIISLLDE